MKVAYLTGVRELEIGQQPRPALQGPGEVLLRIDMVGVCGSDVHYYCHGRIGDQILSYPATVGHECAGTVVDVAPEVRGLQPGDRVAVDPAVVCGKCDQCLAGRSNTCRKLRFMGGPGEELGALAEYRVLPAENCFAIPDSMSLEQAVLAEPLSIGLHAVGLGQLRDGARLAILGAGPIGLSVLLCAKATAACTVYATDLIDRCLEAARRCGADWIANASRPEVVSEVAGREPRGLDVVFECSGDPARIDQALAMLAPGGALVLVGIPAPERIEFDPHVMRRKELVFEDVRRQRDCVGPVLELIAGGRLNPEPLLTHRFPLEAAREAFELVAGYRDGVIKAVIDVGA